MKRRQPNSSKPNQTQTKPDQENGLGFSWIPSSDSGLFKRLRAVQIKNQKCDSQDGVLSAADGQASYEARRLRNGRLGTKSVGDTRLAALGVTHWFRSSRLPLRGDVPARTGGVKRRSRGTFVHDHRPHVSQLRVAQYTFSVCSCQVFCRRQHADSFLPRRLPCRLRGFPTPGKRRC